MPVAPRPEIAALPPYRQGRPAAADAHKLSSNENPFPPHPAVLAAISDPEVNRYPEGTAAVVRDALAARYATEPDLVHVTAGSVSALYQLVAAFAGPGDEVLYAWRSFEAYPGIVTVSGAASVTVPLAEGARHDLDAMIEAITERTKVIIVCSPNNPTGPVVTSDEFAAFLKKVPDTVLVVLDEAYREFVTDPAAIDGATLLGAHDNLVVLRTFSKAYGLAGLRVGYALGPLPILDAARSTAIPLAVTAPAQRAALAAIEHEAEFTPQIAEIVERRDRIVAALREQGWAVPEAQGNFVWLPTGEATASAAEALEAHGIVARVFPGDGIRVSIGEESSVEKLLRAAAEVVATL